MTKTPYYYQDCCRLMGNESLRDLATKAGAWGFYARAELARRDRIVTFGE